MFAKHPLHSSTRKNYGLRLGGLLLMAATLVAGHAQAKHKPVKGKGVDSAAASGDSTATNGGSDDAATSGTDAAGGSSAAPAASLSVTPAADSAQPTAADTAASSSAAGANAAAPGAAASGGAGATASASDASLTAAVVSPEENAKLIGLRTELTGLMDELVQARSRAAVVGKSLFKTRMLVRLQNLAGPDPVLAKVVLKLDGAPIYRGDAASLGGDEARNVYEGFVAPGPHVLGVELEQRARDDAAYGYSLRESYNVQAVREKQTELTLVLDDDSDMADDFPDDGDGKYDVRMRLRAKTRPWNER